MEHSDKMLLALIIWGIALVMSFAIFVSLAKADDSECVKKAEDVLKVCRSELGDKVQICDQAYLRTLLTCQINKENQNFDRS